MVKRMAITGLCMVAAFQAVRADTTTVSFDSGGQTVFNQAAAALSGGTSADGDGTVLQLGYYDGATIANNFLGNWVALSGATSLNTAYNQTSIGDLNAEGGGNGTFFFPGLNFVTGSATSGNSLPGSTTIPLSIRFYNSTTIASSTFFNVVSDDLWVWKTPAVVPANVTMSLDDTGLEWLSTFLGQNSLNAFHTTIAIPEPSTVASLILGGGVLALVGIRRRSRR